MVVLEPVRGPLFRVARAAMVLLGCSLAACAGAEPLPASSPPRGAGPDAPPASAQAPTRVASPSEPAPNAPVPVAVPAGHGPDLVRGRATVNVDAPIERAREAVLDFAHYAEFMPHYKSCRVLGRTQAGARDVYMEVEALFGAVRMWTRVAFPKPAIVDGVETYETTFLDGNVKDFKAIWRLRPVDAGRTELSLEVFLYPKLPLPSGLINDENLDGAVKGVLAMKAHAEGRAPSGT